jgi:hypothetical protein
MNPREHRARVDAAEWDVVIGWSTGIAVVALRAFVLVGIAVSDATVPGILVAQVIVQVVLAAALAYGTYRRHRGAAIGQLVLWGLNYAYSWYALGRLLPPLGIIGLLVCYGLYRGVRGTQALTERQADAAPAA